MKDKVNGRGHLMAIAMLTGKGPRKLISQRKTSGTQENMLFSKAAPLDSGPAKELAKKIVG